MFFPGSFIWKHISDEWLTSRKASVLFGASSVLILGTTAALYNYFPTEDTSKSIACFWCAAVILCAACIPFLWGGMWRFWMIGDPSNRLARGIWFLFLAFGVWYGAVFYYVFVYLPATYRREKMNLEDAAK
jgi:hypothetical protein